MPSSYVTYTGNGAQTQFVVTFPFISRTHVAVYVNGSSVGFTWVNDGLIQCNSAPANGSVVRIERSSSPTTALVNFTAGFLSEADLDTAYLHTFYLAQEAVDTAEASITLDSTNNWDAQSKRIKNVANASASTDAITKAQLDAAVVAAGNVPTPGNPADDRKVLRALAGAFGWGPVISTFAETLIDDADAAAARVTLDAQEDVMTANGDLVTRSGGATARLAVGSDGQFLKVVSGAPAWAADKATVTTISATTHSPGASDSGKTFIYTNASGCTVTLPSTATAGDGWYINTLNASGGNVVFNRSGSDDIDGGGTSVTMPATAGYNRLKWEVVNGDWFTSTRRFRSSNQTITSSNSSTVAHSLGATPRIVNMKLKCITAELNYSVGDEVFYHVGFGIADKAAAGNRGMSVLVDGTNITFINSSAAAQMVLPNKTTFAQAALTNANWAIIFEAEF